jgi:chromosome segregation ATPase
MGKDREIADANRAIANAEVSRAEISEEVQKIDKEIFHLNTTEALLINNINYLKKNKVIAMAREFKKASDDLKMARTRLNILKNDQKTAKKALENAEKLLQQLRKKHITLLRSYSDNVLRGNFGSRNNG